MSWGYVEQMTKKKPFSMSIAPWVEQQINNGIEAWACDDLPGKDHQLPSLGGQYQDDRWLKDKLKRGNPEITL